MKRRNPHADPELEVLLEGGRVIQPVPDVVRARSLSRARATMAAMAAIPHEPIPTVRRRGLTVALGGLACLGRRRRRRDSCPSRPSAESQPASPARDPLRRAADAQLHARCVAVVAKGRATIHVHRKTPTLGASSHGPGVLCGRARLASAGSSCVRGPRIRRCARAGR
jgi:hypothetical protein